MATGHADASADSISWLSDMVGAESWSATSVGPTVAVAGPSGSPTSRDPETADAIEAASATIQNAASAGIDQIGCPLLRHGIPAASQARRNGDPEEAEYLLSRALQRENRTCDAEAPTKELDPIRWHPAFQDNATSDQKTDSDARGFWTRPESETPFRDRAHLLRARIRLETPVDDPAGALNDLEDVSASTPVEDFRLQLKADALVGVGELSRAADTLQQLYEDFSRSPLRWEARTREGFLRVKAGEPGRAIPIFNRLLELFPDHPRRFRLLYHRAIAHQKLGNLREAARQFQETWLAFPHKKEGELALARVEQLERLGIEISPVSNERLLDRYRELRTNKHWELAGTLLRKLLDSVETDDGHSGLEHRIWFELGMNAYTPQFFEQALPWFERLRDAHDRGFTEGIDSKVVDKYLERTYGKLGRVSAAIDALQRRLSSSSEFVQTRETAELLADHTRYEEAYRHLDSIYSDWAKKRWQYTWLLYKTGRLERASTNFRAMARRLSGTGEQRATYWRARSLERLGNEAKSQNVYASAVREGPNDYYGILAASRLLDMQQREAVSDAITRRTREVVGNTDEVLGALETAAEVMEGARTETPAADQRLIPRDAGVASPSASRREWTAQHCRSGTVDQRRHCHLAAGRVPPGTESFIGRLLAPSQGLSGLSFGNVGGLVFSGTDQQLARQRTGESTAPNSEFGATGAERGTSAVDIINTARRRAMNEAARQAYRLQWHEPAHVFWKGRSGGPPNQQGPPGPIPRSTSVYGSDDQQGSVRRAATVAGRLFPELRRARWLDDLGFKEAARHAARRATLEFRGTTNAERPSGEEPVELEFREWQYLIDHRSYRQGFWSYTGDEVRRYPIPDSKTAKQALVARQQTMQRHETRLRALLTDVSMDVGDFHMVRELTKDRYPRWYTTNPTGDAAQIWRQMHPRAFFDRVAPRAKEEGLNPYLIWSLMGVESAFNPDSISRAEAIGLLQVIPRTGIKVASWLGDEDFGPYDLTEPSTAIHHGTRYFGSLVDKFRGQMLLAIIGYNAGPHRVAQWLDQRGNQPLDEFVEEVPFSQARGYVRKVTGYLKTYLTLYEGQRDLYIGQRLDRNVRFYPNF